MAIRATVKIRASVLALLLTPPIARASEVLVDRWTKTSRRAPDAKRRPGQLMLESRYTIDSRQKAYRICYRRYLDPELDRHPPHATRGPVEIMSGIGLERPMESGWYWRGFFDVIIDGMSLGCYRPKERILIAGPKRGATFSWDLPNASVDVAFAMLPMSDGLYLDLALKPKKPLEQDIEVKLIAFPCGFRRDGLRTLATAVQTYVHRKGQQPDHYETPNTRTEWWWLFADKVHRDATRNRGPCGVLFPPGEPRNARVLLGSYSITASLFYEPRTEAIRLCFVEYPGLSNERALPAFRKFVDQIEFARLAQPSPAPVGGSGAAGETSPTRARTR